MMKDRLFLIDGHALIFKMYYAFLKRPMINSKGLDTSILFGFMKCLLELVEREKPTHLAVSFDPPGGTFRNEMYPEYKANRAETPRLVIDALEPLTELCRAMNIPVLMVKGYEADDVIGTVAKRMKAKGLDTYMVTPDKDYGQLIEEGIWQYKLGKSGENEVIGVNEVCARYGISNPLQVIDMLTICGDTSDNVPGVNGIGEVGAGKLIGKYGSVESIYDHLDELSDHQKSLFEAARDHIALSRDLVTIRTDVPVEVEAESMRLSFTSTKELSDLFDKYEFNSLRRYIPRDTGQTDSRKVEELDIIEASSRQIMLEICTAGNCALFLDDSGANIFSKVSGMTVATCTKDGNFVCEGPIEEFRRILEDPTITKYGYDMKLQTAILANGGISVNGKLMDIQLMHYLLDPEKQHKLDYLEREYVGTGFDDKTDEAQTGSLFDEVPSAEVDVMKGRHRTAVAIHIIGQKLWVEMQKAGVTHLYEKMEAPLQKVLSKMERTGVYVDVGSLSEFASSLREEIAENEAVVREIAREPQLNVSSPKQLGEVIFEKLKLDPKVRKGKNGYSTDEATLVALRDKSPIIDSILEYRGAKKLLSTYIDPFPSYINPSTGRVHTTFNQALTATGRLSSSNPNLQNIPVRTERGKEIRKAFVPQNPQGWIMSADYSQIELRIMAHLSCDEHLIKAFNDGVDVHSATASKIFNIPLEEVTSEQRRMAKTANFGIMYGISAFGLSERLGVSRSEAKKLIDDYFESFPSITSFIEGTLASARENGYVETLFGRRRWIPDINSTNATVRALAERNAVNAPIQGTAADIIKMAMVAVDRRLSEGGLAAKMVLQIHDELLLEVSTEELDAVKRILVEEMENVIELSVPLTVECKYGKNWLEAH